MTMVETSQNSDEQLARNEPTLTGEIERFVRDNPTLALAGVAAAGAIVALAVMSKRRPEPYFAGDTRRELARYTKDVRRAVRQELRDSGLENRLNGVADRFSSIDWTPYVKPVVDQAVALADEAKSRIATLRG